MIWKYWPLALIASIAGLCVCLRHEGPAALIPDETHYNFGTVDLNQQVKHRFVLRNTSSKEAIVVEDVKRACSCSSFKLSNSQIPAGGRASLEVEFNAGTIVGGRWSSIAIAWHNEKNAVQRILKLEFGATVAVNLTSDPQSLDFGSVDNDHEPVVSEIELARGNSQEHWSDLVLGAQPANVVAARLQRGGNNTWLLRATLDPRTLPVGLYSGGVELKYKTRDGYLPATFTVPLHAKITSTIACSPAYLYIPTLKVGQHSEQTIRVTGWKNPNWKIKSCISSDPEFISVQEPRVNGGCVELPCLIQGVIHDDEKDLNAALAGSKSGTLVIEIDADRPRKLLVPYIGTVDP